MPTTRSQTGSLPKATRTSTAETTERDRRLRVDESMSFLTNDTTWEKRKAVPNKPLELPRFVIDLSLPPEERYLGLCAAYKEEMLGLRTLFDDVVGGLAKVVPNALLKWICWILLRGLYDKEEHAELKGISKATGVEMYLLVCLNVLLDLFMGCSSGGAAVRDDSDIPGQTKMVHFRTLDWGMPTLRRVLVQLDFKLHTHGEIVASSVTYAGFTGVLTGVRKDLSLSLNFRGLHNDMDKWKSNVQYYGHHLMVLLGLRPSISSVLRAYLLRPSPESGKSRTADVGNFQSYNEIVDSASCRLRSLTTSACYLCISSGEETTILEKDRITAVSRSSKKFIVVTNADSEVEDEEAVEAAAPVAREKKAEAEVPGSFTADLAEIIHEANDRKQCAEHNYRNLLLERRSQIAAEDNIDAAGSASATLPTVDDIVEMVQKYPTTNECTHFAAVMDPKEGKIAWSRYWMRPVDAKWIRDHTSEGW